MFRSHIKLNVLKELAQGDKTGYDLLQADIADKKPSPGYIYPLLKELTQDEYISAREQGRKTLYHLTPKGKKFLATLKKRQEESIQRVVSTLETFADEKELKAYTEFRTKIVQYREHILKDFEEYKAFHEALFVLYNHPTPATRAQIRKVLAHATQQLQYIHGEST